MIFENATVRAIDGDTLWLETLRHSACAKCAIRHGCGQGWKLALRPGRAEAPLIAVRCEPLLASQVREGQQVELGVDERVLAGAALAVYLLPLGAALLGAVCAQSWSGGSEGWSLAGAAAGFGLGFFALRSLRGLEARLTVRLAGSTSGRRAGTGEGPAGRNATGGGDREMAGEPSP